jgi:hypothetical protein
MRFGAIRLKWRASSEIGAKSFQLLKHNFYFETEWVIVIAPNFFFEIRYVALKPSLEAVLKDFLSTIDLISK